MRLLAQLTAGEAAVPERYFGFITSNPPSGEALAAEESRLVKRAERRQTSFGQGWLSVGLAAKALDSRVDEADFLVMLVCVGVMLRRLPGRLRLML